MRIITLHAFDKCCCCSISPPPHFPSLSSAIYDSAVLHALCVESFILLFERMYSYIYFCLYMVHFLLTSFQSAFPRLFFFCFAPVVTACIHVYIQIPIMMCVLVWCLQQAASTCNCNYTKNDCNAQVYDSNYFLDIWP